MIIRAELEKDKPEVYEVNKSAFDTSAEADLVDALRKKADPIISLVAEEKKRVVGHILFTSVSLSGQPDVKIIGLAPMAVLPEVQNKGIGSALVRAGLEKCQQLGFGAVVVLGHPEYYPRFGFVPSTHVGIRSEYDIPENVFMIIELITGYLKDKPGVVKYHKAFGEL